MGGGIKTVSSDGVSLSTSLLERVGKTCSCPIPEFLKKPNIFPSAVAAPNRYIQGLVGRFKGIVPRDEKD